MKHGGDIYRNNVRLDFSVNVNPLGTPAEVTDAARSAAGRAGVYPDLEAERLRERIAVLEGRTPDEILTGNGASELFMAIVHAFRPETALVASPCYSGYEYALAAADCRIERYALREDNDFRLTEEILDHINDSIDMVMLADPNNPNGLLIESDLLERIADRCSEAGSILVLDRCFAPLTHEKYNRLQMRNIIEVKAFTKVVSVPGLRIGYMMSDRQDWLEKTARQLPEWNVSVTAQEAGAAAADVLLNTSYLDDALGLIALERQRLGSIMTELGLRVFPSDTNYLLVRTPEPVCSRLLGEHGILVRDCSSYDGMDEHYIRVAVRTRAENDALIEALKAVTD